MPGEEYWRTGRWSDMLPLMKTMTILDPHFVEVSHSAAWHIAYNLSAEVDYSAGEAPSSSGGFPFCWTRRRKIWTGGRLLQGRRSMSTKGANPQAAAEYFEKAAQFADAPDVNMHILAHAYEDTADIGEALGAWQKSLEINPDDRIAQGAITTIQLRYVPAWREYRRGNVLADCSRY